MKQTIKEETIQEETDTSSDIDVSSGVEIEGGSSLKETIEDGASSMDVRGFECADCGVHHNHDTTKHKASDSFALGEGDSAESLEMNGVCHCGYNEVAMRGSELGLSGTPDTSGAFNTAPIPEDVHREMKADFC